MVADREHGRAATSSANGFCDSQRKSAPTGQDADGFPLECVRVVVRHGVMDSWSHGERARQAASALGVV